MVNIKAGGWVLLRANVPKEFEDKVHHARDGRMVGIYLPHGLDSLGEYGPGRIMLCTPTGENLLVFDPAHDPPNYNLFVLPSDATDIGTLDDIADMPPGRIVDKEWLPRAQRIKIARAAKAR